eukprot:TRINITY_DN33551_c0_g1_i3.p1 TRINITY_DN33551_c0_g1~~TRINITY_DN33551_c0_g1_i3.p1  ORF type:complete len:220 (+),score=64.85 TRINITY_DN33551_c0_g1_i3:218-877(+)
MSRPASAASTRKSLRGQKLEQVDKVIRRIASETGPKPAVTSEQKAKGMGLCRPSSASRMHRGSFVKREQEKENDAAMEQRERNLPKDKAKVREQMSEMTDRLLKRLLVDVDFAAADKQIEPDKMTELRCNGVDRIHAWYMQHRVTEKGAADATAAASNKAAAFAPAYITFEKDGPVMPGSLRRVPTCPAFAGGAALSRRPASAPLARATSMSALARAAS